MLSAGHLAEQLRYTQAQTYSVKVARVGIGDMSPPTRGFGGTPTGGGEGPPPGKF